MSEVLFPNWNVDPQGRLTIPEFLRGDATKAAVFALDDHPEGIVLHFLTDDVSIIRDIPYCTYDGLHIIVQVDHKGRAVIPAAFRKLYGFENGSEVEWTVLSDNELLISPAKEKLSRPYTLKKAPR